MSYENWIVIVILLALPVALLLIWLQTRKGKDTKMSRQEKLAKAARDVTVAHLNDVLGVLNGERIRDDNSFIILYRRLNQFKHNQWRRHEGGLKEVIESAVITSGAKSEKVVDEMMVLLFQLHAADGNWVSLREYLVRTSEPDEWPKILYRFKAFLEDWLHSLESVE